MNMNSILSALAMGGPMAAVENNATAAPVPPHTGYLGGRNGPAPPLVDQKPGLLSRLMGGVNRFSDELLHPTTSLGKLGMYLGAATGGDLGRAGMAAQDDQRQFEDDQAQRAYREAQAQTALFKAYGPKVMNIGGIVGMADPTTGGFTETYRAPTDPERYAESRGFEKGTPDWNTAMEDYVLRGNGPTAFDYDVDLENARQGNRVGLENLRSGNRAHLRGQPTYSDTHPRPSKRGTPPVIGGIPPAPKPGRIVTVKTPQEADALPPGTVFKTPDGRLKVSK